MGMINMNEVINADEETKVEYEIPSYTNEFKEEVVEEEFDEVVDLGNYEIDLEIDDIFEIADEEETKEINSVNISGTVEKIVFNEHKGRNYLTLDIKNIYLDKTSYFKITFFDEDALEFKNSFDHNEFYTFFNLVLTITKNRNTKNINPRLIFDKNNRSYC